MRGASTLELRTFCWPHGGIGCAHGRVLFIFGCNTGFSAYECGFGCGEYRVFLFGVGGADFAFAIVEDADGMDSGGVDQIGYQWNPAGGSVDFVEGEPEARTAYFSGRLDFVNVAADLCSDWEGGAFRGG